MIDYRKNEIVIVEGLKAYLSNALRPCEVVRANQIAKTPPYPYVSYTVTSPMHEYAGGYSQAKDGTLYRSMLQTWSFTVQSNDEEEALTLAYRLHDYFSVVGRARLADNGITVRRVRDITARDNLITIQYEYRKGLDVTFGLLSLIAPDNLDVIKTTNIKEV